MTDKHAWTCSSTNTYTHHHIKATLKTHAYICVIVIATDPIALDLDPSITAWLSPLNDKLVLVLGAQEDLWSIRGARNHDVNILWLLR